MIFSYPTTLLMHAATLIPALIGIGFLIAFHELGHLVFCKLFNVAAPHFSIGFGPHLFTKKYGETSYSLSAIPLGGYVAIAGEDDEDHEEIPQKRLFANKPYYQKLCILLGGIIFNILFAYIALTATFMTHTPATRALYPTNATTTVQTVLPNSPAEQAGLSTGDVITSINGHAIGSYQELRNSLQTLPQNTQHASLTVRRNNKLHTVSLAPSQPPHIGVIFSMRELEPHSLVSALGMAHTQVKRFMYQIYKAVAHLLRNRTTEGTGGIIMIFATTMQKVQQGITIFTILLAFLSINLACVNLIPLPVLDGGQVLFVTLEAIAGRELPTNIKTYIMYACWLLLIGFTIYMSYNDVITLVKSAN